MPKKYNSSEGLHFRLKQYEKKGGKTHRAEQVKKVYRFIDFCGRPAAQIGNKHVKQFFNESQLSPTTKLDYYYAIRLLWKELRRTKLPPKPPNAAQCKRQGVAKNPDQSCSNTLTCKN